MKAWKYPKLHLYTIKDISNRIQEKGLSFYDAGRLLEDCLKNKDNYWFDNISESKPDKGKWVRSASSKPLGKLQKSINQKILASYDDSLPPFIYGGVGKKGIKDAAKALQGQNNKRTILKIDLHKFFEHISYDDIVETLAQRCSCSLCVAQTIAEIACVEEGPKSSDNENKKVLARGFSTSSRLAVWCNLDLFIKIFRLASKRLKGHDFRIAIYMDDIGITASRISPSKMASLYKELIELIAKDKANLEVNIDKTKIVDYLDREYSSNDGILIEGSKARFEFLGILIGRNSLSASNKTRSKIARLSQKQQLSKKEQASLKGLKRFANYIARK